MKLESLTIIFLIIIIPMALVLSEYIDNKIETANNELTYDTRLFNATYDAVKAYQINTVNNAFGDVTNSKIEDIESAANVFLNSLANNFDYTGYKLTSIQEYVPAVVFTLYDGYYIYSPFNNTLTEVADDSYDTDYSKDQESIYGLKPYVYYSCRYTPNATSDFTITYTLDNYITIQGKINNNYIYDYGYLYSIASSRNEKGIYKDGNTYWYDGVQFTDSDTEELKEFVGNTEYSYVKINGKKYYLDENYYQDRGSNYRTENGVNFKESSGIFFIDTDGTKNYNQTKGYSNNNTDEENKEFLKYYRAIKENKSAYEYYKNSYEFSCAVLGTPVTNYTDKAGTLVTSGYGLKTLKSSDSAFYKKQQNERNNGIQSNVTSLLDYGDITIFEDDQDTKIQNKSSKFNQHRQAIIRYIVETNLSASIESFSSQAGSSFIMPKISEEDWDLIENDVCAITFLQGMSIGSKKYNGYSVVANTLTKEYIDENDIYILTDDNMYCRANDSTIRDGSGIQEKDTTHTYYPGIWKLNFERKQEISSGTGKIYYYPISYKVGSTQMGYLGSYTSIMGNTGINSIRTSDMYTYMSESATGTKLKKAYYVALGRERWGAYNVNNVNYEIYKNNGNEYYLKDY